jgi:cellulose synthase (UDP-forming)
VKKMPRLLPALCARARSEIVINGVLLLTTMGGFILFFLQNYLNRQGVLAEFIPGTGLEIAAYNAIFVVFMYGSFTYQASRLSFFMHIRTATQKAEEQYKELAARDSRSVPHVEIIVPSYREESHVIWQTLMSAALVTYPSKGVVLLLDNPPFPTDAAECDLLLSSRAQVEVIESLLAPLSARFSNAADRFRSSNRTLFDSKAAAKEAASLYEAAADFLDEIVADVRKGKYGGSDDHTRNFFVERILCEPAQAHRSRAKEILSTAQSFSRLKAEFDRLSYMFKTQISLFERKKYLNLSHSPTKAANLNSYISLMGKRFKVSTESQGNTLIDCGAEDASDEIRRGRDTLFGSRANNEPSFEISDAKYVVILDADSFVLADYVTCMVSAMEAPENGRAAVMQTPYTVIPGTRSVIEKTAGATTDIYYYVTEGMGFANAGTWVGASATIRKEALLDIATTQKERGFTVSVYIQDKTVIEDTGATIDLIRRGWSVRPYPARLSYSATPPDFGALVVQRRRWSNGGLIILPSLLRHLATKRPSFGRLLEALLRFHYLSMPALLSISMLTMLMYPFDFKRVSGWIYVTLPPYLYLTLRDLNHMGYRFTDLLRAYSLFLLLLPVVLAGVKNSIHQIIFGRKAEFGRTPKIDQRTAAPVSSIAAIVALFAWSVYIARGDLDRADGFHALFASSNALAIGYGIVAMVGLRAIYEDIVGAAARTAETLASGIRRTLRIGVSNKVTVVLLQPLQSLPADAASSREIVLNPMIIKPQQEKLTMKDGLSEGLTAKSAGAGSMPALRALNEGTLS